MTYSFWQWFLTASCSFLLLLSPEMANGQAEPSAKPLDVRQVALAGELGRRIDLTIEKNILAIDHEQSFLRYFRQRQRAPFSYVGLGKEIDALVRLAYYTRDPRLIKLKQQVVAATIQSQQPDGYIGIFAADRLGVWWDLHELSYIIRGLVQDHRYFGNKEALAAARRAGDYIIGQRPVRRLVHHVSTIGYERGLLALSAATGDARYVAHANHEGSLAHWQAEVGGHAYDYLSLCLAQLDLYDQTADPRLLKQSKRAVEYLTARNGLLVDGTCSLREGWHDSQVGAGDAGETCATAYLIRLCDKLLQIEGDPLYGDLMERAIYNALFAAQSPDGRELRKYTPLEGSRQFYQGEAGSDFQRDAYCCPNNFRRAIADLPGLVYYHSADAVLVNLYGASRATVELGAELGADLKVQLEQVTDYPNSGDVLLKVSPSRPAKFAVKLRIPRWCRGATLRVPEQDGEVAAVAGTWSIVRRTWKSGDTITLKMPMPVRLVQGRATQAGKVAVLRGPLLFCLNPLLNSAREPALAGQRGERGKQRGALIAEFNSVEAQLLVPEGLLDAQPNTTAPPRHGPEHRALLARRDKLQREIAAIRTTEEVLTDVRFDFRSIAGPLADKVARPDGLALTIQAWGPGADRKQRPNLKLLLTEFADPGGEMTHLRTDQPDVGVEDELFRLLPN